jgi:hypothetical protein
MDDLNQSFLQGLKLHNYEDILEKVINNCFTSGTTSRADSTAKQQVVIKPCSS